MNDDKNGTLLATNRLTEDTIHKLQNDSRETELSGNNASVGIDKHLLDVLQSEVDRDDMTVLSSILSGEAARWTLDQFNEAVISAGCAAELDALNIIIPLLLSRDPVSKRTLELLGREASAKEVILGLSEASEGWIDSLNRSNNLESDEDQEESSAFARLDKLLHLAAIVIPRLPSRPKSLESSLIPLVSHLSTLLSTLSSEISRSDRHIVLKQATLMIKTIFEKFGNIDNEEAREQLINNAVSPTLDLLGALSPYINAFLAQRYLELTQPRQVLRSAIPMEECLEADRAMRDLTNGITKLLSTDKMLSTYPHHLGTLIIVAHSLHLNTSSSLSSRLVTSPPILETLLPSLITALRTNVSADEALYILFYSFSSPSPTLSSNIPPLLLQTLVPLCASHPLPATRHLCFRIIKALLTKTDKTQRLYLLRELVAIPSGDEMNDGMDDPLVMMRIAALSLVKDFISEALDETKQEDPEPGNPFTSPLFLQTFGSIVMLPNPPNLFEKSMRNSEKGAIEVPISNFMESPEPTRLVECLGLLYVVLNKDHKNLTGIRDRDRLRALETNMVLPISDALSIWMNDEDTTKEMPGEHFLALVALRTAVERVREAIDSLQAVR